jgi:hypothetical protein
MISVRNHGRTIEMKQGRTVTKYILLLSLICILAGIAAAGPVFSSGDYFSTSTSATLSTSTSASVQGTINETVSFTKTTIGGDKEKTELTSSFTSVNPFGLSWRSLLSVNADQESARVDYTRNGDLPQISWSSISDGSSQSDSSSRSGGSPRFIRAR